MLLANANVIMKCRDQKNGQQDESVPSSKAALQQSKGRPTEIEMAELDCSAVCSNVSVHMIHP